LLLALKKEVAPMSGTILDFGAGISPYRPLSPDSVYRTADIVDTFGPDYVIDKNGSVPERSGVLDLVLSTQVLAHVRDPQHYLAECFRLVRPGGRLLLSTNSNFADGDCPGDYQRWTAQGLRRDLEGAGFANVTRVKFSTGPRAVMYFIERYVYTMGGGPRNTLLGWTHRGVSFVVRNFLRRIHVRMDRDYAACRVVPADAPGHDLYIGLVASAERPADVASA
jgi:SAM-dependent methyltransferase